MFARLQTVAAFPRTDDRARLVTQVTGMISAHPGFAGLAMLEDDEGAGTMLTLWHTREDADPSTARWRSFTWPPRSRDCGT